MIEIIMALIALVPSCGWLIDRKRHQQELLRLRAETQQKEFDLSAQYVKEFKENICKPLQDEVQLLRTAIEEVNSCKYSADCPVIDKLHKPNLLSDESRQL